MTQLMILYLSDDIVVFVASVGNIPQQHPPHPPLLLHRCAERPRDLWQQPHPAPRAEVRGGLGVREDDLPAQVGGDCCGFLWFEWGWRRRLGFVLLLLLIVVVACRRGVLLFLL